MLPKVERLSRQTPEKVTVRVDARPARDLPGPHEQRQALPKSTLPGTVSGNTSTERTQFCVLVQKFKTSRAILLALKK